MRLVRWQAVARSLAQAKEVTPAEFGVFVEAQTIGDVDVRNGAIKGREPRSPVECVQDALLARGWYNEGGGANIALVSTGTVEGLLDIILTATPDELSAIRETVGIAEPVPAESLRDMMEENHAEAEVEAQSRADLAEVRRMVQ